MAIIFLSYRRTDGPQACRVHDWLAQRFGKDAIFMDVSAIPFAVSFPEFIKDAIAGSKVLLALIGPDWFKKIAQPDDAVRMELETALEKKIPVLPVLIGNTPMPAADDLPKTIAPIAYQNALTVGVLHDFDTHMKSLVPEIESILGKLSSESSATANPDVIRGACEGIVAFLREKFNPATGFVDWQVLGASNFQPPTHTSTLGTLYLHRISPMGGLLDLHFILSFWAAYGSVEHSLAGWVLRELDRTPVLPPNYLNMYPVAMSDYAVKIRRSDEDSRQVWKMITDLPLRLSVAYVATISKIASP